jgi:hypothetical protein
MDLMKLNQQLNEAKRMAAQRTAILWGSEDLLGEALEAFLGPATNWRLIRILGSTDLDMLAREVEQSDPEIVIVNQGKSMEAFPIPIQLIRDYPELKIITVNSGNNLMEVYTKQEIWVKQASDLLSLIDHTCDSARDGGEP